MPPHHPPAPARALSLLLLVGLSPLAASCGGGAKAAPRGGAAASTTPTTPAPAPLTATAEPWSLTHPVSRPVVLADGGGLVILGGLATGDVSTSRVERVDLAAGRETSAGRLAVAVHDSAGAVLAGRFYVFAGGAGSTISTVQAWSAATASEVGHLPSPRSDLAATSIGATAYIVGGFDGTAMDPEVLSTADGTTFQPVAALPVPVRYAAVATSGGVIWAMGGVTGTSEGSTATTDAIQRIDPSTGRATLAGHLPAPLGHASALTIGGQVYLIGGRGPAGPSAAIWRLDPATATVSPAGSLPRAVSDAGAVVVGGVGYLVGGETTGPAAPLDSVVMLRS